MGNSEVGHLTMGTGRILQQDLLRINKTLSSNINSVITPIISLANEKQSKNIHFLGLISDGGVHSHINHVISMIKAKIINKMI